MAARSRSDALRTPKPRSDIYTGLLVLAFLAQITGVTFLVIDYLGYAGKSPPAAVSRPPLPAPPAAP